ncbi:MAG: hypothetical protein P8X63_10215 [Desulfuromonadaceae bacterium]
MKKHTALFIALALSIAAASPVLAAGGVDTTKVYNSGFLVLAFLGFCAMIVVAQLIPAIILLVGTIRSALQTRSEKKAKSLGV